MDERSLPDRNRASARAARALPADRGADRPEDRPRLGPRPRGCVRLGRRDDVHVRARGEEAVPLLQAVLARAETTRAGRSARTPRPHDGAGRARRLSVFLRARRAGPSRPSSSSTRRSSGAGISCGPTSRPATTRTRSRSIPSSSCRTARTSSSRTRRSSATTGSVGESLQLLDGMNAIDKVVVVGIYSGDRMAEYTKPGYEAYGRSVVEEIVPVANGRLRLIGGRRETAVMGSSLGGVVSFYMAWQFPEVFGGRGVPVEHVLAQGRPRRPRPQRAEERGEVLHRQRLARRQLRDDARDGDRAPEPRLRVRPRLPPPRVSARDARGGRVGRAACTCRSSSSGARSRWRSAGGTNESHHGRAQQGGERAARGRCRARAPARDRSSSRRSRSASAGRTSRSPRGNTAGPRRARRASSSGTSRSGASSIRVPPPR